MQPRRLPMLLLLLPRLLRKLATRLLQKQSRASLTPLLLRHVLTRLTLSQRRQRLPPLTLRERLSKRLPRKLKSLTRRLPRRLNRASSTRLSLILTKKMASLRKVSRISTRNSLTKSRDLTARSILSTRFSALLSKPASMRVSWKLHSQVWQLSSRLSHKPRMPS